jgi:hypothetical protein
MNGEKKRAFNVSVAVITHLRVDASSSEEALETVASLPVSVLITEAGVSAAYNPKDSIIIGQNISETQ